MARNYSNSYFLTIFACCREIFDETKHCGGIDALKIGKFHDELCKGFQARFKNEIKEMEDMK